MYTSHYHSGSLNVPFIMFFLNMVNYPVFFLLMSTLMWDTFLILRGSKSYGVGWWWVAHKILVSAPVPLELI